jgi:hypothetical protein
MRRNININNFKTDFNHLKINNQYPFLKEKNFEIKYNKHGFIKNDDNILLNIKSTLKLLENIIDLENIDDEQHISIRFKRTICNRNLVGLCSPQSWHFSNSDIKTILCVSRENINGGINEFSKESIEINPGFMIILKKNEHNTTPIIPYDFYGDGYRDTIITEWKKI